MRLAWGCFALAAAGIVLAWSWLGTAVEMPQSPFGPGEKLGCVSYAPFRGSQNPLEPGTRIEAWQIDQDLAQLKTLTDCIRTYSIDHGLDQIPAIARRHGMKVLHGLWLSSLPDLNKQQIETTVALAKQFPDVIEAIIVGNEVLLRGEMSAPDLAKTIREVKAQVPMPVTYADVWEFWLRYRELAAAADFITIHILPYWEDIPLAVGLAAPHVDSIRKQVAAAFPGKDILVGEFGWPSAGRMREGALPSPINQAWAMHQVVALAKRDKFRLNVIEAYDQPWKRKLEGTVGGHWGLYDAYVRRAKFEWGRPVSNHAYWRWQAAGGVGLAALTFAAAFLASRRTGAMTPQSWLGIGVMALMSGTLIGWTVENLALESLTTGDWVRSLSWAVVAGLSPPTCAAAIASRLQCPSLDRMLGRKAGRPNQLLTLVLGILLIATLVLAIQAALGLVFDPRYRDFPFAPLSGAAVSFLVMMRSWPRRNDIRTSAETVAAATLALAATYILLNETLANWQAAWFCAGLVVLAISLLPGRVAPG